MIGRYDLIIAALSVFLSLSTVVVCVRYKYFLRYYLLNFYLLT